MTSLPWVSWINCVRLVLVSICCSTLENCTSSLVNWLVSSGLVGSWFCNCVISSLRKSPKFADSEFSAVLPDCDAAVELAVAAVAFALFCCAVTVARLMGRFLFASCGDVEAAAHPARQHHRREFGVGAIRRAGVLPFGLAAMRRGATRAIAARSPRLHARRGGGCRLGCCDMEGDSATFRRDAGLVQRALQLWLIP